MSELDFSADFYFLISQTEEQLVQPHPTNMVDYETSNAPLKHYSALGSGNYGNTVVYKTQSAKTSGQEKTYTY